MRETWLTDVVSVPQGYLLLGRTVPGEPRNWRSADGVTWTRLRSTPLLFDVATSDTGALVGIGFEDIYHSPRGLRRWEKVLTGPEGWQVNTANSFGWVAWDGAEFVVVGNDNGPCGAGSNDTPTDPCHREPLLVSVDGTAWSEAAGPDGLPGADEGAWMRDIASLDDSTVVLGLDHGVTTVWTISAGGTR
jgi:hypothetical protein